MNLTKRPTDVYQPKSFGLDMDFYARAATSGEVHIQQCKTCGNCQHPPRFLCSACASKQLTWQTIRGTGTVYSWSLSHFTIDSAWTDLLPYATVVVESLEGVRFVGTFSGPQNDLTIGLPVNIRVESIEKNFAYLWLDPISKTSEENG